MEEFGLLVGRHFTTLPTLTNEQPSELQLDSLGRLIIAGRFLEDSAHTSGDPGIHILGVRSDAGGSLVDTDGDYSPLSINASGELRVEANVAVQSEYAEDSEHSSGATGQFILGVRNDANTSLVDTDGDYAPLQVDSSGRLKVAAVVAVEPTDAEFLEDSAHSSGDTGLHILSVRQDTLAASTDEDGDYASLKTNSVGELYTKDADALSKLTDIETTINDGIDVTFSPVGSEAYTVTDALAAGGDGLETITAAGTPWVTVASLSVGAGTTAYVYGWQFACDQNCVARIMTDDGTDEVIYKVELNSSAQPGREAHWGEGGRIEIPGAAGLELRIEMRKRSTPGGNANGTGSLHVRTA